MSRPALVVTCVGRWQNKLMRVIYHAAHALLSRGCRNPLLLASPVTCHFRVGTRRGETRGVDRRGERGRSWGWRCKDREGRDDLPRGDEDDAVCEMSDIYCSQSADIGRMDTARWPIYHENMVLRYRYDRLIDTGQNENHNFFSTENWAQDQCFLWINCFGLVTAGPWVGSGGCLSVLDRFIIIGKLLSSNIIFTPRPMLSGQASQLA